eukprot:3762386-Amphidinium_carterae.3
MKQAASTAQAFMSKHEVFAEDVRKAPLPMGRLRRMLKVGFSCIDSPVLFCQDGNRQVVLCKCRVRDDLPFISWEQFSLLRDALQEAYLRRQPLEASI